jgi:hypothetical protein
MVWIYEDSQFSPTERKLYLFLKKKRSDKLAEKTVKILKLLKYLKKQDFNDWKEVQNSAFYDSEKTKPIFSDKVAKVAFRKLQKRGGDSSNPVVDSYVRSGIGAVQSFDPTPLSGTVNSVYDNLTGIVDGAKQNVPLFEYILHSVQKIIHIGNIATLSIAADVAGPIGLGIAEVPVVFSGLAGIVSALAENDMGKAVELGLSATPFGGPSTAAIRVIEEKGGKRFSTKKNRYNKWPRKTMRKRLTK